MRSYKEFMGMREVSDPIDPQAILKKLEDEITVTFNRLQQSLANDLRAQMQKNQGFIKKARNWWDKTWHGPNSPQAQDESIGLEPPHFLSFKEDQSIKELVSILQEGWINDSLNAMTAELVKTRDAMIAAVRASFTELGHNATPPVPGDPTTTATPTPPGGPTPAPGDVPSGDGSTYDVGRPTSRRKRKPKPPAPGPDPTATTSTAPTSTTTPTPTTAPVPPTPAPTPTTAPTATNAPDPSTPPGTPTNAPGGGGASRRRRGAAEVKDEDVDDAISRFGQAVDTTKQGDSSIDDGVIAKARSMIDAEPDKAKKIRMAEFLIKSQPVGVRPAILKNPECLKFASHYNVMALNKLAPKLNNMLKSDPKALDGIGTLEGFNKLVTAAGLNPIQPEPTNDSVKAKIAKMVEMFRNGEKIVIKPRPEMTPSQKIEHYKKILK